MDKNIVELTINQVFKIHTVIYIHYIRFRN